MDPISEESEARGKDKFAFGTNCCRVTFEGSKTNKFNKSILCKTKLRRKNLTVRIVYRQIFHANWNALSLCSVIVRTTKS